MQMQYNRFLRSLFSQETPGMSLFSDETEPFERCIGLFFEKRITAT
jgi:hypothetical protein